MCLPILSACGTKQLVADPISVSPDLLQDCDPIPQLKAGAKMTDLLDADVKLCEQYKVCAARQAALATVVK